MIIKKPFNPLRPGRRIDKLLPPAHADWYKRFRQLARGAGSQFRVKR